MSNDYTEEEKLKVVNYWNANKNNDPSLSDIVLFFSDGQESDPRKKPFGKKVRQILIDCNIKPRTSQWNNVDEIILTDEQKEFIGNHCKDNKTYEMAKVLFPNVKLAPLGREVRTINKYLEEIGHITQKPNEPLMAEGRYEPPDKFQTVLSKINQYLYAELATQTMTAYEKKCVETTKQFLHAPRFIQEINTYTTVDKRIAFESEFIRAVYTKPDLSPEEVSLTINWCSDIIQAADIKKQLEKLNEILNDTADSVQEEEKARLSMSLSDTIGKVTTNLNEVLKRQERIYAILNKKRADRKAENENKVGSLTALFEWAAEESNRKKLLDKAKLQEKLREKEIERLESLDDLILLSLGMSKNQGVK